MSAWNVANGNKLTILFLERFTIVTLSSVAAGISVRPRSLKSRVTGIITKKKLNTRLNTSRHVYEVL